MRKEPGLLYRTALIIGDSISIILAFALAYFYRIHIDSRPFFFEPGLRELLLTACLLLPVWLIILMSFGLYKKSVVSRRLLSNWRLFMASIFGICVIISFDYFLNANTNNTLFPARIIAVYAAISCYVTLVLFRVAMAHLRTFLLRKNYGLIRTIIVGNSSNVPQLVSGISPESGFKVVGVVADSQFVPSSWKGKVYADVDTAIKNQHPEAIIHAGNADVDLIHKKAVEHHASYYYSPDESSIITMSDKVEFIAGIPIIPIPTTTISGGARIYKRATDLLFGGTLLILSLPFIAIVFLIQKIIDPKAPALFLDTRLTRYDRSFKLYKFRSIRAEYSGLTPEQAFEKMGRPELIKKYRANGDKVENDPRYTRFGLFIRKTSLDELPQLINVIRGDISLIGPRALEPEELANYGDRGLILSVKSGLTGLAQVSGRRDISFGERRALDVYYVQNWTPVMDIQILFRTVSCVLFRRGAK